MGSRRAKKQHKSGLRLFGPGTGLFVLGILSVLVMVGNTYLYSQVKGLQTRVSERERFLQETVPISRLNERLVQSIANLAAATDDEGLRKLLAAQGIGFRVDRQGGQ